MSVIEHEATELVEAGATDTPANAAMVASPLDLPIAQFTAGLDRRRENRDALMSWVKDALVENTDFGVIPTRGRQGKPSLWKPGAEKILGMLGLRASLPRLRDYETAAIEGRDIVHVILRCEIFDGAGNHVADGIGARSLKQDQGDINKCLKMACKSAVIDATLRCAGLSEVFTQDLEDMVPAGGGRPPPRPSQQPTTGAGRAAQQSTQAPAPQAPEPVPITDAQATTVRDLIAELESTLGKRKKLETTICAFYRVDCVESIPAASYEQCIRKLELRRQEVAA